MAEIQAGDLIASAWWPESVESEDATLNANITSTAFIAGTPEVGVGFTSPSSGRVAVCVAAAFMEQSAGDRVLVSFEVYQGTSAAGTLKRSARSIFGVSSNGDTTAAGGLEHGHGNMIMVDNLTAGVAHYARLVHAVDAGTTNDVTRRRITVVPLP